VASDLQNSANIVLEVLGCVGNSEIDNNYNLYFERVVYFMKRLILICGANGIGKSTACKLLNEKLPRSAFIDSDYCRQMNPFSFTDEEIQIVISNISTMMVNYFKCSTIDNVIFQYGFHGVRKQIFDSILDVLSSNNISYYFCPVILYCELDENLRRMKNDNRDKERILRAIEKTRNIYDEYEYPKIDSTHLSVNETVSRIMDALEMNYTLV